jgi:hypothetical protein
MGGMGHLAFVAALLLTAGATAADGHRTPGGDGAAVYFINLKDGDAVASPLLVQFGLSGMGIAPAGTEADNTGHHHLLINRAPFGEGEEGELDLGILADDNHRHFGGGQTETLLDLPPGAHTLQLVLGDLNHAVHATPVASERITITVSE